MLYEELTALTKNTYYGYERHGQIFSHIRDIAQKIIVAVGGYRLVITHVDDLLISVTPKATSAGRGEIIIDPWDSRKLTLYPKDHKYANVVYAEDPCGGMKLKSAITIVECAAIQTNCVKDLIYKALGRNGSCAICGATLTDELSMTRGIGPECYRKIYVTANDVKAVQKKRLAS